MNSRELATVLAALRLWQRTPGDDIPQLLLELADCCGEHAPLTADEIDDLCERLNLEFSLAEEWRAALEEIIDKAPDDVPEEEDYDDTESAYNNGIEVGTNDCANIARRALGQPIPE
jgi:hypothetical protein